ncbi:stage III sporulation protein AF [Cohnella endophytica]|uniref:Stage III sporulation protein AF n=1 Tax=Cohnella endophytica TaxID=2419778 RepID=A0A494Y924_9BACL|nr:stage III sporulation protein AF [Cohnella endophytica]RKP57173.1 stage III sporulation protein AF [Cohnella endophytica]
MGLMDGLSHWLRQIIAVILLASLIDLLLPNRTMQRYVRLVAGLFILMTLATPIMHWMKGDFDSKLAAGLNSIELEPRSAPDQLAMIEEAGAKLRNKQQAQAAELVTARLEASIRSEVEQSEHRGVSKVDVKLERRNDGSMDVAKVVVSLEPAPVQTTSPDASSSPGASAANSVQEMQPVTPVDIRIEVETWPTGDEAGASGGKQADKAASAAVEEEADRVTSSRISALIASRFGIATNAVEVKTPKTAAEAK